MALLKLKCPECKAGLKSSTGFTVGESVSCPKCETEFTVEEPRRGPDEDDDAGDDMPTKKRKKGDDDDYDDDETPKRSYKNSPLRYAVLGILVVVMLVLGYFLYDKKKKEREANDASTSDNTPREPDTPRNVQPPQLNKGPDIGLNPNPNPPKLPKQPKGPPMPPPMPMPPGPGDN